MADRGLEDVLRPLAGQVLGVLVRRYGQFDACEDAVQEALLDASVQWPDSGVPEHPKGWLVTVASRRLTDQWRSESARRRREATVAALEPPAAPADLLPGDELAGGQDDTLTLLFLCCHPALAPASQVALTLRAVGGLTTTEIARAFLVPEATMAQRISRAKQRIKASGTGFRLPSQPERSERLPVVLHVLYLVFNEGYTASSGPGVHRAELTIEAIRLTRAVHAPAAARRRGHRAAGADAAHRCPAGGPHPAGRHPGPAGRAGPVALGRRGDQRGRRAGQPGAGQRPARPVSGSGGHRRDPRRGRQAAGHRLAPILALYGLLERLAPGPAVTLNRAVAVAMVAGPRAGLEALSTLDGDGRIAGGHRAEAVRAHLLELAGDRGEARAAFTRAARRTTSLPEQRYLQAQAAG